MGNSSRWPDQALVGYVIAYNYTAPPSKTTNEMITEALSNNYKVFVYSFGYINNANVVSLPDGIDGSDLAQQLTTIHNAGGLALLSFGGQNNTYSPGPDANEAAENTAAFMQKYGFDGVDLDLEDVSVGTEYLEAYIATMREKVSGMLVTCAPQIAGGYGGPASFAPANIFTAEFLKRAQFDAVLVQEYNQYGGAVFDGKQDTDVGFISASFVPLTQIVPSETKIVVGEPSTTAAGSGLSDPQDVVTDISSGSVRQSPQYGGIMTWAINYDAGQDWAFARGVSRVVGA